MNIIDFNSHARRIIADRSATLVQTNQALYEYATGALGVQEAARAASLSLISAPDLAGVIRTVTQQWPSELDIDMVGLALVAHDEAFRAGPEGIQRLPARRVRAWAQGGEGVHLRAVEGATQLFGDAGEGVKTVGVAPLTLPRPLGLGILAFGSLRASPPSAMDDSGLLDFLAAAVSRKLASCLTQVH